MDILTSLHVITISTVNFAYLQKKEIQARLTLLENIYLKFYSKKCTKRYLLVNVLFCTAQIYVLCSASHQTHITSPKLTSGLAAALSASGKASSSTPSMNAATDE